MLRTLTERLLAANNARGSAQTGPSFQIEYLRWFRETSRILRGRIARKDVDGLLPTASAWQVSSITPEPWNRDVLVGLVDTEFSVRIDDLTAAHDALQVEIERWDQPGRLLVPDTSLYINHPNKLDDMVLADDLHERETPLRVIVPIIVIDELDGLKQSSKNDVRARARQTLAILARVLSNGVGRARLREADFTPLNNGGIPRGEVTVEILFDPPSHQRLPINDDEIIDRAVVMKGLPGRPVTMITYDTGQTMRARAACLEVLKLSES